MPDDDSSCRGKHQDPEFPGAAGRVSEERHLSAQGKIDFPERCRTVVNTSIDGCVIADSRGCLIDTNDAYCRLIGYTREELLGKSIADIEADESAEKFDQHLDRVLSAGSDRFETLHRAKDGRAVPVEISVTYSKECGGLVAFVRDISERKRAEAVMHARLRLLRFSATHSLEELLQETLDEAGALTGSPLGFYHFVLPDQRTLSLQAWSTHTRSGLCSAEGRGLHYNVNQAGVWADCIRQRRPVIHNDYAALPERRGLPAGHATVVREAVVPIFRKGGIVAVIGVGNKATDYDEKDIEVVSLLADLAWDIAEGKRTEDQLNENRLRYEKLLFSVTDYIYTVRFEDGTPVATEHRQGCLAVTGYTPEEFSQHPDLWLAMVHPEDCARVLENIASIRAGRPQPIEHRIIHKNGLVRWIRNVPVLRWDDGGSIIAYDGVISDITERRNAEQARDTSERNYRQLVDNMPDVIARFDPAGRCLYVSPSITRYTDRDPSSITGKPATEIAITPELGEFWADQIRRTVDGNCVVETQFELTTEDDRRVLFNWRLVPEAGSNGAVESVLSIARDITEHNKVERDYWILFTSMVEGLALHEIILDESDRPVDYRFLAVNPAFERMTGLKAVDVVGKRVLEVLPDIDKTWIERYGDVAVTGKASHFEDYSVALKRWFEVFAYRPAMGQFACIFTDITERKRLEEQLRQAQKMEAVGTLAGGVAHDFNNILQAIVGNAHLLQEKLSDEGLKLFTDEILTLSVRAADLTRSLLAFGQRQVLSPRPLDLNELIRQTGKMVRRLIPEDVVVNIETSAEPFGIFADQGQMQQVLINLVTNARDAMPGGGALNIRTYAAEKCLGTEETGTLAQPCACLAVSDTGMGIAGKDLPHIFDPFFTTKETGKGSGLGLSVVYGIIRQHKGTIEVASTPGEGTAFLVCLPLLKSIAPCVKRLKDVSGGAETILLVEDDERVRRATRLVLEGFGYRVLEAADGPEAIGRFRDGANSIDLVLMDVVMPRMNGKELYERLTLINPRLKAIFLSGYSEDLLIDKRPGNVEFVPKPVMPEDLLRKVRDVLDRDRQR